MESDIERDISVRPAGRSNTLFCYSEHTVKGNLKVAIHVRIPSREGDCSSNYVIKLRKNTVVHHV